jgi:hypothetical protein
VSKAARDRKKFRRFARRFTRAALMVLKNKLELGKFDEGYGAYRIADAGTDRMRVERL